MLENYKENEDGIIYQVESKKYQYNDSYIDTYNKFGEVGRRMSFLRLGNIIGSIGYIPDIEWVKDLDCKNVAISLPNCHYKDDQWFEEWKHRKPDEHLWHFNKNSLVKFMERMGHKLVSMSNVEDIIRKNKPNEENILTGIFEKL